MNNIEQRAKTLWNNPHVSEDLNYANAEKWARAVEWLGDKWILHSPITLVKRKK